MLNLRVVDRNFFFYYKYNRSFLIDKFNFKNIHALFVFDKVSLFVKFNEFNSLDLNNRIIAGFFLLKYLSKKKPYIVRLDMFQTFKKRFFNIIIRVDINEKNMNNFYNFYYFFLTKLLNNLTINSTIEKSFLEKKNQCFVLNYKFDTLDFLKIVEMHFIFFKWNDKLNLSFHLKNVDREFYYNNFNLVNTLEFLKL